MTDYWNSDTNVVTRSNHDVRICTADEIPVSTAKSSFNDSTTGDGGMRKPGLKEKDTHARSERRRCFAGWKQVAELGDASGRTVKDEWMFRNRALGYL